MVTVDEPFIFPIGHYLGAHHEDGAEPTHVLRIGWDVYRLHGQEQLGVWALAHGLPEGPDMAPWTRSALEGAARVGGIPTAAAVLDDLLAEDLVIEVPSGGADAADFARTCRLRSLLLGIGNSPEDPLSYGIGVTRDRPSVQVPTFGYELWKWGHVCDSLWHVCEVFARAGRDARVVDAEPTSPERVLPRALAATQVLVAHGAAYLDEARET